MIQTNLNHQTAKFISRIAENLPELTKEEMQFYIQKPEVLKTKLNTLVPEERNNNVSPFLLSKHHPLIIDACSGLEPIFHDEIFDDSGMWKNFKVTNKATEAMLVQVYAVPPLMPLTNEQIFKSLAEDLDTICLTQHQIKLFCKKYKNWLTHEDTIFLTNDVDCHSEPDHWVGQARKGSLDQINTTVVNLEYDGDRPSPKGKTRIVIPQIFF